MHKEYKTQFSKRSRKQEKEKTKILIYYHALSMYGDLSLQITSQLEMGYMMSILSQVIITIFIIHH